MNADAIGPNIRRERLANGWSLRDLEARSGVTFSYIHALEQGNQGNPTIRHVLRLADALGITITEILTDAPDESSATGCGEGDALR